VWLERTLALAAGGAVASVLLVGGRFDEPFDRFTLFALTMGLSLWFPVFARTRWSAVGEVYREGAHLVVAGRLRTRRVPLASIRGARFTRGGHGGSLLVTLADAGVLTMTVDDPAAGEQLAEVLAARTRERNAPSIPTEAATQFVMPIRAVGSLLALGYYLHVVRNVIGGDKAFFGLGALFCGIILLLVHLFRPRGAASTLEPLAIAKVLRAYPSAMRPELAAHLQAQTEPAASTGPVRAPLVEPGEGLAAALARLRAGVREGGAYRNSPDALRVRLEQALEADDAPLADRALSLRILGAGRGDEVKRRIEATPVPDDERAFLEDFALAPEDGAALKRLARKGPRFAG
jgi:hypothetical protein